MFEKQSLFKEGDRDFRSTLIENRRVSVFAGKVFQSIYGIKNSHSRLRTLGRIIDLQPVMESGKVRGVRLLFRLCEMKRDGQIRQHRNLDVQDRVLGPFDSVHQIIGHRRIREERGAEEFIVPIQLMENVYALSHEKREQGEENRYLRIEFMKES